MSLAHESDTIAAIATPPGDGGISVIRISGDEAFRIVDRGFRGKRPLAEEPSHTAHQASFADENGQIIDSVVALVFRKPHSYTGENVVELSCHGGQFVTKRIVETLIRFGARAAGAGEFTKRAFLNGRLDLTQAEAVADLIHSRSERAHLSSVSQLNGLLSGIISGLRERLIQSVSLLELELDFAEDGYEFTEKTRVAEQLRESIRQIDDLLKSYSLGRIYRDGVRVALAGAPNVGKSSLLNALLREERAIVTSIPGTTRDIIEESITLGGLLFSLSDTAGLRETVDPVEKEGVRRAEERLAGCDILVLMLDSTKAIDSSDVELIRKLVSDVEKRKARCIIAINKVDLMPADLSKFGAISEILSGHSVLEISAMTHEGFGRLEEELVRLAIGGQAPATESGIIITNARHYSALGSARKSLQLALDSVQSGRSGELIAVDLRAGIEALDEIIGTVTTDDILNSIFSAFCIGK